LTANTGTATKLMGRETDRATASLL